MGIFRSSGDEYDDKQNTVTKKTWHKSPTVFHKGGRNGYKLHITGKGYIIAVETPDGELVLFEDWEKGLASIDFMWGSTNFYALEKRADRRVSGMPTCHLTADWTVTMPDGWVNSSAVLKLKDNEISIHSQHRTARDILSSIDGINIVANDHSQL
jgi:hypothetical protein